ncbi:tyrosine-type recombinase/integrase [Kozakia baliensis]|uniref:tyrosine-type recombinase/integrase n=1 Tax=Kozakia baliensis TaxID=153496 RepID=UPI000497DA50|nr:site-specific integrase [Kozakia baliensis]
MKLTKTAIDALTCPLGKQDKVFTDSETKGLSIRVTEAGSKVFRFEYRFAGKVRRLVLGPYGQLTLAQARRMADEARGRVLAGGDPVGERQEKALAFQAALEQKKQEATASALTFDVLIDRWLAGGLKDRSANHRREAPRRLRVGFPSLLNAPAQSIPAADVQLRLDLIAENHPTTARRLQVYGRAMFSWANKRGLVSSNPFANVIVEGREIARDRVLSDTELGAVWRAASSMTYPFGPFLQFLTLTLQRRSEVAGMRWEEISSEEETWTVPADRAKNGKAHIVHLSKPALDLLHDLPRLLTAEGNPSPFVFTSTARSPISGFSDAKERLDELMLADPILYPSVAQKAGKKPPSPAPRWTLHDLRRTGVTAMARLGIGPHIADMTLNHVQGTIKGVAAVYQRHHFLKERAAALDIWARHVLQVSSDKEMTDNNVMPFRTR